MIFPVSPLASSAHIALFFPFSSALTAGASSDCLPPPPQPSHAAVCWQGLAFTKGGESLPTWGATSRCCGEFVSAYQKKNQSEEWAVNLQSSLLAIIVPEDSSAPKNSAANVECRHRQYPLAPHSGPQGAFEENRRR